MNRKIRITSVLWVRVSLLPRDGVFRERRPPGQQPGGLREQGAKVARWQNLIPSFPWIAPGWRAWGAIQGKEGIKFCSVA